MGRHLHQTLLEDICIMLAKLQDFKLQHVYRECNQVVDLLANYGTKLGLASSMNGTFCFDGNVLAQSWSVAPSWVLDCIEQDKYFVTSCIVSDGTTPTCNISMI